MSIPEPTSPHEAQLRDIALAYPETHEDFPWGERAFKVRSKTFLFMSSGEHGLYLSMKLPISGPAALDLPFVAPTGYNLGKSGWITAKFKTGAKPPIALLRGWIDESFRAVAPKRVVAALPAPPAGGTASPPKRRGPRA